MGKIITLSDITLTDSTAPRIIRRDPIESDGSLFLFDGAHQFGAFSGVPALSASIPNVLANKAASLLSVPEASTNWSVAANSGNVPNEFIIERTSKGGLHGISSLTAQTASRSYVVLAPEVVRQRLANNLPRAFYVSIWSTVTRKGDINSNAAPQSTFHQAPNTSNALFYFTGGMATVPSVGNPARLGGFNEPAYGDYGGAEPVPYARFGSLGFNNITGTGPGTSPLEFGLGAFGAWGGFNINKTASRIIYRVYVEDLASSGRSYAAVQAIDYALFQAAFAPGGKFHNDTYTSPATLP